MERKPFPSETQERFIIRFPDGMRDRIKEAADANNRSMNAEIVARLESSFMTSPDGALLPSDIPERLHKLERTVLQMMEVSGIEPPDSLTEKHAKSKP